MTDKAYKDIRFRNVPKRIINQIKKVKLEMQAENVEVSYNQTDALVCIIDAFLKSQKKPSK